MTFLQNHPVHGQFFDLLTIFELNGLPSSTNPYLFNGDFVDRGHFSTEVITLILALKLTYPEHVHLNRGNHEHAPYNAMYGFQVECCRKYDDETFEFFNEVFSIGLRGEEARSHFCENNDSRFS